MKRLAIVLLFIGVTVGLAFADDPGGGGPIAPRKPKAAPSATTETPAATPTPAAAPAAEKAPNFTLPNAQDGMTRVKWPREKATFVTFGEQASQASTQA